MSGAGLVGVCVRGLVGVCMRGLVGVCRGGRGLVWVCGGQGVSVGGCAWWAGCGCGGGELVVYVWGTEGGVGGWVYVIVTNLIDKCIILVLSSLCRKMLTKQIHFVKKTS